MQAWLRNADHSSHCHFALAPQVRLNFLSRLLDEAHGHLHNTLCASELGRKLIVLPFNRDVAVSAATAREMHACLQYALQVRDGRTRGSVCCKPCCKPCCKRCCCCCFLDCLA
jgi:hypothetical protein